MSHKILRLPEVIARTGLGRSTIYNKIALDGFPTPVRLGERSVGWIEAEVDRWIARKIEVSRAGGGDA